MRPRMMAPAVLAGLLLMMMSGAATAGPRPFPDVIALPGGFAPEGITTGRGSTFYTGSLSGAGIWAGDYRTGAGGFIVEGGGPYVGMAVDAWNRLWVAGGPSGSATVFDATTGEMLASFQLATGPTFVNDVIVTRRAAWFTDSFNGVVHGVAIESGGAIGQTTTIDLTSLVPAGPGVFRLNGIEATADGGTLIAVDSTAGTLLGIDAASGDAWTVDLGGASVSSGDGILLRGRTLHVLRNFLGEVAVVELAPNVRSGAVVDVITPGNVDIPTTLAGFGSSLYLVNARFTTPVTPDTEYWVTRVDR